MGHSCVRSVSHTIAILGSLLLIAVLPATLTAQETSGGEDVFAPFASRLRLSIRDPQIRVSWEDAAAPVASYRIYRAEQPITNETLNEATLVTTVAAGREGYIDIPPTTGEYYYAVLAESPTGQPYRVAIPGRNASFRPVEITNIATERERAARVAGIEATVVSEAGRTAIEVTAAADREGRTLAFYRSPEPIREITDLDAASLVREVPSDAPRVVDLPVPGVGYYYAAVDSALLLAGDARITPGENATLDATEIPLGVASASPEDTRPSTDPAELPPLALPEGPAFTLSAGVGRGIPLPFLQIQNELSTGRRLGDPRILIPERRTVGAETEADVQALLARLEAGRTPPPQPTVLPQDTMPDPQGAEYTLRTILDGPFARMAWERALTQLENYLTLPLTPELEARVHFYRAQIYYFLGQRQRAILEFLLARDRYYVEVEEWLGRILGGRARNAALHRVETD